MAFDYYILNWTEDFTYICTSTRYSWTLLCTLENLLTSYIDHQISPQLNNTLLGLEILVRNEADRGVLDWGHFIFKIYIGEEYILAA